MVESYANGIDDKLIDSLQFKLKEGASYINERKSVTFYPQGSNIYKCKTGTRVVKILLSDSNSWLDPTTLRIMFDLRNNGTTGQYLRAVGGPWSFFRRAKLVIGGQTVEDIDYYGRTHEMMHTLQSKHSRENDHCEGFGNELTIMEDYTGGNEADTFYGIPAGQSMTVLFKPLFGLFTQTKFLPLSKVPIVLELELVDDVNDCVVRPDLVASTNAKKFTIANTTNDWHIENFSVKVDLVVLDNGLQSSYDAHLLGGASFPINYNTFITQCQNVIGGTLARTATTDNPATITSIGQQKINISVSRAVSRLKSVFVTLDKDVEYENNEAGFKARKSFNDFYSPMNNYSIGNNKYNMHYHEAGEFEFQMQIGSVKYPQTPIRSHSEAYYQLKKCLGIQSSTVHSFDINAIEYRHSKMIIGIDTERQLGCSLTGIST